MGVEEKKCTCPSRVMNCWAQHAVEMKIKSAEKKLKEDIRAVMASMSYEDRHQNTPRAMFFDVLKRAVKWWNWLLSRWHEDGREMKGRVDVFKRISDTRRIPVWQEMHLGTQWDVTSPDPSD